MNSELRGLAAIVASVVVFVIWYSFVVPHFWPEMAKNGVQKDEVINEVKPNTPQAPEATAVDTKAEAGEDSPQEMDESEVKETETVLENDLIKVVFTNYGGRPASWRLKQYEGEDGTNVEMVRQGLDPTLAPLEVRIDDTLKPRRYRVLEEGKDHVKYIWSSDGIEIEKTYTLGKGYDIALEVVIRNKGNVELSKKITIGWGDIVKQEEPKKVLGIISRPKDRNIPVYMVDGRLGKEKDPSRLKERFLTGSVKWVGIENRYFLSAIALHTEEGDGVSIKPVEGKGFLSLLALRSQPIPPGGEARYSFTVYGGPKEIKSLKEVGLGLERAIDYGWFGFIAVPILHTLKFLYRFVHNWGIAIILLTILIKILLHPISKSSMRSMREMQKLQPKIKEIRERYKNDRDRLNLELMQLFKTHKVNPMGGCLPMLLQLPIYIALYRVLWNAIELYRAPFFWFYKDLSQPDPYYITPILLGIFMVLQQILTPQTSQDPAQQKMMYIMPILFTVFLLVLPAGLVIYILVNTLFSVVQQWMMRKELGVKDIIKMAFGRRA